MTALLESRPINATPVDLDVVTSFSASTNDSDCNRTNSIAINNYPGLVSIENSAENAGSNVVEENDFPGVIPIENVTENSDIEAQFDVVSPLMVNVNGPSDNESAVMTVSNSLSNR